MSESVGTVIYELQGDGFELAIGGGIKLDR
jgi:hypothetical protein